MRSLSGWLAAALFVALVGCGGILPKPAPPPQLYRLTPLSAPQQPAVPVDAQLVVGRPTAPAALDTERIVLSRGPNSIDYFANAAWTDHAPEMMRSIIIESLENAGAIRVVARESPELRPDAVLSVDLRHFEAGYSGTGPPELRVTLDCRIVRLSDHAIIAVRTFDATARAGANDISAIVAGFDAASHDATGRLVPWAAQAMASIKR